MEAWTVSQTAPTTDAPARPDVAAWTSGGKAFLRVGLEHRDPARLIGQAEEEVRAFVKGLHEAANALGLDVVGAMRSQALELLAEAQRVQLAGRDAEQAASDAEKRLAASPDLARTIIDARRLARQSREALTELAPVARSLAKALKAEQARLASQVGHLAVHESVKRTRELRDLADQAAAAGDLERAAELLLAVQLIGERRDAITREIAGDALTPVAVPAFAEQAA